MRLITTIVFFAAFLAWAWLEFGAPYEAEGMKDILFWVGMGALLVNSYDRTQRSPSRS